MFEINHIYTAYRKLKGDLYYDASDYSLLETLSEWEKPLVLSTINSNRTDFEYDFSSAFSKLLSALNQDEPLDNEDLNEWIDNIDYRLSVKSIETKDKREESIVSNYSTSRYFYVDKYNCSIKAPIEIHIISVLWIMCLRHYLVDGSLYGSNYANVLRRDTSIRIRPDNNMDFGISIFRPYFWGYRKWRNQAVDKATALLEDAKNAIILNLDLQRYYYSVDANVWSILEYSTRAGYVRQEYIEDLDLIKLTKVIQAINERYSLVIPSLVRNSQNPHSVLLPVGLSSSSVLANLYLSDFDAKIESLKNQIGCQYYGRYVDDMLFVFSGKINQTHCRSAEAFVNKLFVGKGLLDAPEDNSTSYKVTLHPELNIQSSKVNLQIFSHKGPHSAVKQFAEKLKVSDFRLYDSSIDDTEFEQSAYELSFSDSSNKLRNISAFKEDRYGASMYLARKINRASMFMNNNSNDKTLITRQFKKDAKQILKYFQGYTAIDSYRLWEKAVAYFFLMHDIKSLRTLYEQINESIHKLKSRRGVQELNRLKSDLIYSLQMIYYKTFAVAPRELSNLGIQGLEKKDICYSIRLSNMFPHNRVGCRLVNYTRVLEEEKSLLGSINEFGDIKKFNESVLCWLSPRFVSYSEVSSLSFLIMLNKFSDVKSQISIMSISSDIYEAINSKWTGLFGQRERKLELPYSYKGDKNSDKVVGFEIIDKDVNRDRFSPDKHIALANIEVKQEDFSLALKGNPNLSSERVDKLFLIFDDAVRNGDVKTDMLVFPELSIPYSWLNFILTQSKNKQIGIVAGLEYIVKDGYALNILLTILPVKSDKYHRDCILIPRIKNYYSPKEKKQIQLCGLKTPNVKTRYDFFHWRKSYFSCYNCFELASIEDRSLLKSKVDFIVASEYNRDTYYYQDVVGSLTRDLHCYVIQTNTSQYGDSCILQPTESYNQQMLYIKGGETPVVMVGLLEIEELRAQQLALVEDYMLSRSDKERKIGRGAVLKPTPPSFSKDDIIIRQKDSTFEDIWGIMSRMTI